MEEIIQSLRGLKPMNIANSKELESIRKELKPLFNELAKTPYRDFESALHSVTRWEYALGAAYELIPYERIVPTLQKTAERLFKPSRSQQTSKNLISYGFNEKNELTLIITRLNKDCSAFGINIRHIMCIDKKKYILNAHIYESRPSESRLVSLCLVTEDSHLSTYVSITPPNDWYVRIDQIVEGHVMMASTFATSWFTQINYEFTYSDNKILKVVADDKIHWQSL